MGDQTYSGRVLTPAVKVTDADGLTLSSLDYTLTYSDNIAAGTATVDIEGRHNYTATSTDSTDFTIRPNSGFTIDTVSDCVYTGSAIEPALTIKDANNTLLIAGTDYTVAYTGNVNAGTASASITGKGNFTGSKSVSFTITKRPLSLQLSAAGSGYVQDDVMLTTIIKNAADLPAGTNLVTP